MSDAGPGALRAEQLSIEKLLGHVKAGKLRMPGFQRGLVWNAEDVRLLLDSVYNGYPIGMLLFWEKPAEAGQTQWGPCLQDVPKQHRAWWIVDGQHRIAVFVLAWLRTAWNGWALDPRFTWFWDVRAQRLVHPDGRGGEPPNHWLPLFCVADMISLIRWGEALLQSGGTEDEVEAGRRWARTVADFELLAYVTEATDEQVVRRIFDRTNTTGKGLGAKDVFRGLHDQTHPDGDSGVDLAVQTLSDMGFGAVDRQLFVKALLALEGRNLTQQRKAVQALDERRAVELIALTRSALQRCFRFLREECGIPSLQLLPYHQVVHVLARFFHFFPDPGSRSRILLRRWLWRGAVAGSHAMGERNRVRKSVQAVQADDEEASVQRLMSTVPRNPQPWPETEYSPAHAASRIEAVVLASWQPRDLKTGRPFDMADALAHGLLGQVAIALFGRRESGALAAAAANRLLAPGLSAAKARARLDQVEDERTLASHGLTRDDIRAWRIEGPAALLLRRAVRFAAARDAWIAEQCEWGRSDRPSIEWLRADADASTGEGT